MPSRTHTHVYFLSHVVSTAPIQRPTLLSASCIFSNFFILFVPRSQLIFEFTNNFFNLAFRNIKRKKFSTRKWSKKGRKLERKEKRRKRTTNSRQQTVLSTVVQASPLHWKQITVKKLDIEDVRSFERSRRDGRAFVLTGARFPFREKSEFDAHFAVYHRQRTSALRYLPRLIREIHPTKRAKLDFPPHCASIFVVDAGRKKAWW